MKTVVSLKIDRDIKQRAQKLAGEFGIPLSTLINAQLRQLVRDKTVFISMAPRMSPQLEELLNPIEADIKRGKNLSPPITSAVELKRYLARL
mgnify:CR=1 FL=1